ncbi:MAG: DUF1570 domain-containing protein [Planctomycetes bacterium]|nr:DUF1570 domain-containing protein [Planctomycetota bacterium]
MRTISLVLTTLMIVALSSPHPMEAQAKGGLKGAAAAKEAVKLIKERKPAEALKVVEGAKGTFDADEEWVWWGLRGVCLRDMRTKDKDALESFGKACALQPDCWFRFDWCLLLHEFGRWDEALKEIEVEIDPDYKELNQCLKAVIDGPFKERWPHAWKKLELRSKFGNYHVVSDTGMTAAQMDAVETAAKQLDPTKPADKMKLDKLLAPHDNLVALAALTELARKEYMRFVNPKDSDMPKGKVFKVFFFTHEKDFHEFSAAASGGRRDSDKMLGFYQPFFHYLQLYHEEGKPSKVCGFSEETINTFFHEGWHQFLHMLTDQLPIWMNEGLAEFLGEASIKDQGRNIELGLLIRTKEKVYTYYERIRAAIDKGSYVPFKDFFRWDREDWAPNSSLGYMQGWSIAYYALKGDNDPFRKDFCKFFWECAKGKLAADVLPGIFTDQKLADYEKAWKAYWKKM